MIYKGHEIFAEEVQYLQVKLDDDGELQESLSVDGSLEGYYWKNKETGEMSDNFSDIDQVREDIDLFERKSGQTEMDKNDLEQQFCFAAYGKYTDQLDLPEARKHIATWAIIKPLLERLKQDIENELTFDLDEIENKPWRVFRQLSKLKPNYADTYGRYEQFYSYGGSKAVMKLIEEFEDKEGFSHSGQEFMKQL